MAQSELAQRLGYDADARLLILNCDNLGVSHAANVGVYDALRSGLATSASLMVPAPWAREAVRGYRGADIGVHLTLNSEHACYRWGPITLAPSLRDGNGGYPSTPADLWDHADLDEARRECRAQIERAILWGFDAAFGFAFRSLAAAEGAISPDHYVRLGITNRRLSLERALFDLAPGVTEIAFQPAIDTPEIRAISEDWSQRVDDYHALVNDSAVRDLVSRSGAVLISYADLRRLANTA